MKWMWVGDMKNFTVKPATKSNSIKNHFQNPCECSHVAAFTVAFSEYIFNIILWKNMKSAGGSFSWTFHITSLSLSLTPHTHTSNFPFESFFLLLCFAPLAIFLCKWCRMYEWCKMNWNWNDWNVYRESRFRPWAKLNVLRVLFVLSLLSLSLMNLFIIRFLVSLECVRVCMCIKMTMRAHLTLFRQEHEFALSLL